jgi:hypothetical protein
VVYLDRVSSKEGLFLRKFVFSCREENLKNIEERVGKIVKW